MDEEDEEGASRRKTTEGLGVKEKEQEQKIEETKEVPEEMEIVVDEKELAAENMLFEDVFEERKDDPEGAEE